MNVQVEVQKFGIYYNDLKNSDKVWGIARINNTLVTFWGRRNGKLKFKTVLKGQAEKAMLAWSEKTNPFRNGDTYSSVDRLDQRRQYAPTLEQDLVHYFYTDMSKGKLNTRH